MARGREAAHVATNPREDGDCGRGADAGDRAQKHDQCPKRGLTGLDPLVHVLDQHLDLLIDRRDRRGRVWSHMKRTEVARAPLRRGETLHEKIEVAQLRAMKRVPQLIRSFFGAPSVAYITDW
jgi:hypothetical protein